MTITTLRNGPTPIGESNAKALAIVDAPFLSSITPTADTFKRDQFTDVVAKGGVTTQDGYYSLGSVGGQFHIAGSLSTHQTFRDRGVYNTLSGLVTPAIVVFGKGWGYTFWNQPSADYPGNYEARLYKTRNGRGLQRTAFAHIELSGRSYEPNNVSGYVEGATVTPYGLGLGDTGRWNSGTFTTETGVGGAQEIFGTPRPYVTHLHTADSAATSARSFFTHSTGTNYYGLGKAVVVSPNERIMFLPGYRLANLGSPTVPAGAPGDPTGSTFQYSDSYGYSWAEIGTGEHILEGMQGTVSPFAMYNTRLAHFVDQLAMSAVSSTEYLLASFFYSESAPGSPTLRFCRGGFGGSPTVCAELPAPGTVSFTSGIDIISNGLITFCFTDTSISKYYVSFDKGDSWEGPFDQTFPGSVVTGFIGAKDEKTLMQSGYDGTSFNVYEAKVINTAPYLSAFKKTATIRANTASGYPMPFSVITQLRIADRSAPNNPFAPWTHDYRVHPPVGW
jgi:hypothetical protein